ncbi:MAG TPA: winged helix-turn-helix domain-containing protein, partial [Arenimonas sp.]|nr:winged helix-turn-helix domain-containing protein [Arenimonas sp.]
RSVLRRIAAPSPAISAETSSHEAAYVFDRYRLELAGRRLLRADGSEIELTTREFDLLMALAEQAGRVLTRDQLMQRLHGREAGPFDRAIDVQIGRLRQKIETDPAHPQLIKSVRGIGYLFAASTRKT